MRFVASMLACLSILSAYLWLSFNLVSNVYVNIMMYVIDDAH